MNGSIQISITFNLFYFFFFISSVIKYACLYANPEEKKRLVTRHSEHVCKCRWEWRNVLAGNVRVFNPCDVVLACVFYDQDADPKLTVAGVKGCERDDEEKTEYCFSKS